MYHFLCFFFFLVSYTHSFASFLPLFLYPGFYDYLAWVFEPSPDGAGGDDNVQNKYGLGPYDGLRVPEIEGGE